MYLYIYEIGNIWESKNKRSFSNIISSKSEYLYRCMGFFTDDFDKHFLFAKINHKDSSIFDQKSEKKKVSIKEFLKCSKSKDFKPESDSESENWVDDFIYQIYKTLNQYFGDEIKDKIMVKYPNINVDKFFEQLKQQKIDLSFNFDHKAA